MTVGLFNTALSAAIKSFPTEEQSKVGDLAQEAFTEKELFGKTLVIRHVVPSKTKTESQFGMTRTVTTPGKVFQYTLKVGQPTRFSYSGRGMEGKTGEMLPPKIESTRTEETSTSTAAEEWSYTISDTAI